MYYHCDYQPAGDRIGICLIFMNALIVVYGLYMQFDQIRFKDPLYFNECRDMRYSMSFFTVGYALVIVLTYYYQSPQELIKTTVLLGVSAFILLLSSGMIVIPKLYTGNLFFILIYL